MLIPCRSWQISSAQSGLAVRCGEDLSRPVPPDLTSFTAHWYECSSERNLANSLRCMASGKDPQFSGPPARITCLENRLVLPLSGLTMFKSAAFILTLLIFNEL